MSIFEDFIEYCKEDSVQLSEDIQTWLADYFDLPYRSIPLSLDEMIWILSNLSVENQVNILGFKVEDWIEQEYWKRK